MNNRIYYFTGTGNSLHIARELANGLSNCDVRSVKQGINDTKIMHDIVGIVCPNYSYDVPYMVADFFKKLKKIGKYNYLFVTISAGGDFGYISQKVQKRLKGASLKSVFQHYMPFNYLPFGDVTKTERQQEMFCELERDLKKSLGVINKRKTHIDNKFRPYSKYMKFFYGAAYPLIPQLDRVFSYTDNCNGCDICQKVCPVENITLKKGKPKWNHKCQQCYACIHWCPKKAILCGKSSISKGRYQNPQVKLKDLINN